MNNCIHSIGHPHWTETIVLDVKLMQHFAHFPKQILASIWNYAALSLQNQFQEFFPLHFNSVTQSFNGCFLTYSAISMSDAQGYSIKFSILRLSLQKNTLRDQET